MSRLLDTTVLIDVLRGRPAGERVRALRAGRVVPAICAINVDELWRGVRGPEERALQAFVHSLVCLPLGLTEGKRAGRWRREFAAHGVTLSQADCLIAAAAVSAGLPLATGNPTHFRCPSCGWSTGPWAPDHASASSVSEQPSFERAKGRA